MKKILIPALLVVSAAFAPGVPSAVEFPERVCQVAQEVARPLFWHVWDKLLTRELAMGERATIAGANPEWQAALHSDAVVCIFFHVFLKHAFDSVVSAAGRNNSVRVSIPRGLVRRTVESGLSSYLSTRQFSAEFKLSGRSS